MAQRELANSALALKRSNEELQHFAYVAAHDLRSPLQATNAVAQLMAKRFGDKLGPDGNELVAYITDGVNRMARLVDDLLIFAKAGDLSDAPACPVPMAEVVGKSLTNLDAEIQATGARITFDPLPTIVARETQMLQLMQNIVGNALKYRGADPAVVHISGAQKDTQWIFSVRDNGVGIDPKYAQDVFQPFKRLHGPEYQGSGIGLATCKKIVAAYGGRIWVESEAGKGATFFFTIPMEEDQDIQPPQSASA
jgi:light-regulated signal transduction histidine kinase (bacteriophytochrome)